MRRVLFTDPYIKHVVILASGVVVHVYARLQADVTPFIASVTRSDHLHDFSERIPGMDLNRTIGMLQW
jgi:hypothetical protein